MRWMSIGIICLVSVACNRVDPATAHEPSPATLAGQPTGAESSVASLGLLELSATEAAVKPVLSTACNLEVVDDIVVPDATPIVAVSRTIKFAGWLVDEVSKLAPEQMFLRLYSISGDARIWQVRMVQESERADVQIRYGGTLNSGFSGIVDTVRLAPGRYSLRLAYDRNGQSVLCDNGRAVILK